MQTGVRITGIDGARELTVTWENRRRRAVGRRRQGHRVDRAGAAVERGIGLEAAGVEIDDRGFVVVNEQLGTNVPGVFAVGDVIDTPQLAHVGFAEGISDREDGARRAPHADRLRQGPVGHLLPARRSRRAGSPRSRHTSGDTTSWSPSTDSRATARAMIIGETEGLVKLVTDADGLVLGVHIAGPWATELLAEGYLAVNWEANAADVAALMHPHPTLSEVFGEAAMALTGRSLH